MVLIITSLESIHNHCRVCFVLQNVVMVTVSISAENF